jgi:hypothetical protein
VSELATARANPRRHGAELHRSHTRTLRAGVERARADVPASATSWRARRNETEVPTLARTRAMPAAPEQRRDPERAATVSAVGRGSRGDTRRRLIPVRRSPPIGPRLHDDQHSRVPPATTAERIPKIDASDAGSTQRFSSSAYNAPAETPKQFIERYYARQASRYLHTHMFPLDSAP